MVVDDHPMFLAGICEIISGNSKFRVVASADHADDVIRLVDENEPDLIIFDLQLPGDPLEVMSKLSARGSAGPKILVFSASDKTSDCVAAMSAGASGYALKGSSSSVFFEALECVIAGGEFMSPSLVMKFVKDMGRKPVEDDLFEEVTFTHRESQVVEHLLVGASNKCIANALSISEKTVKYYMTQIMQKLNAKNRVEVALQVQRMNSKI